MRTDLEQDPYAPPPRYKERSGAVMRFVILAALLGAAAWGYVTFAGQQQQTAGLIPPATQQDQRLAESGYQVSPVQPAPAGEQAPSNTVRPAPVAPSEPAAPGAATDSTPG